MDQGEALAERYLRHRGFTEIVHEPDGNVPPDFLVNGRIAVEVRRLNQNETATAQPVGLDSKEIPLLMSVQSVMRSFGGGEEPNWFVRLTYKRPLPPAKQITKSVRSFLSDAVAHPETCAKEMTHGPNFQMELIPRRSPAAHKFNVAISHDDDSGGWLIELLERNLRLCISDKAKKIAGVRSRYPEWWLVFIDQIAFGLDDYDRDIFRREVSISHGFDRVVLVNPHNPEHFFEL